MKSIVPAIVAPLFIACHASGAGDAAVPPTPTEAISISRITPPEEDFFSKLLDFQGIPIKAHEVVSDEAMREAHHRLSLLLKNLPEVAKQLGKAKVELHIIGKDQVTTDLPEWRHDKGKKLAEYNGLTRDERTRGMGGKLVSCGEENLLKLEADKYRGRDICIHEFAHAVHHYGMGGGFREALEKQYKKSLEEGLWTNSYAGSNVDEYFAELSMWYFGTHGDLSMTGKKPGNGPEGLKAYDIGGYNFIDAFYQGKEAP